MTLGDGNWKMGDGKKVGRVSKAFEGSESILLEHYMCKSFFLVFVSPKAFNILDKMT